MARIKILHKQPFHRTNKVARHCYISTVLYGTDSSLGKKQLKVRNILDRALSPGQKRDRQYYDRFKDMMKLLPSTLDIIIGVLDGNA